MTDNTLLDQTETKPGPNWWLWGSLALGVLIIGGLIIGESTPTARKDPGEDARKEIFESATATLDRLEEFDTDPALKLVIERLNQWVRLEEPKDPWVLDPLIEKLPSEPAGLAELSTIKTANGLKFLPEDANHLLETNWLRNIARTARGDRSDDLSRARQLFDWTVRNIQLEDWSLRSAQRIRYRPAMIEGRNKKDVNYLARDVLLFGRGDYVHRAWIFMLLARQENLDVVLLAVPDKDGPHGWRPWLPALVHADGLYLFDTYLGLPIPGPGDSIATLKQVQADTSLLRALDHPDEPYPLKDEELKGVVALIEGSPAYLTRRMQAVEARLAGNKKVVLFTSPSATAERLKGRAEISAVQLWPQPFEAAAGRTRLSPEQQQTIRAAMAPYLIRFPTPRAKDRKVGAPDEHPLFMGQQAQVDQQVVDQPMQIQWCSLWMGRVMHFKGTYTSEGNVDGALAQYLEVMVKDADLEKQIEAFVRAARLQDEAQIAAFRATMREVIPLAKQNAIYWLGLIAQDRGIHPTAIDFFQRAGDPKVDGPWVHGANYNLARVYEQQAALAKDSRESQELLKQAIELLEKDKSAQSLGNGLRAKTLEARMSKADAAP